MSDFLKLTERLNNLAIDSADATNLLKIIKDNPNSLRRVKKQTDKICLAAVSSDGLSIKHVNLITSEISLAAVKQNGFALEFIDHQSQEICLAAVKKNGLALKFVKNQTDKICLAAVKSNSLALEYVKNQTDEICLAAVKSIGRDLKFVKNQTDEICLAAVSADGLALEYVKNQTEEICLAAIKNRSDAIRFVKDQTEEICLKAVKSYGSNLVFVKNQTEKICLAAVYFWPSSISFVKKQTEAIVLMALSRGFNNSSIINDVINNIKITSDAINLEIIKNHDQSWIKNVKNQTNELCLLAVSKSSGNLKYVVNQTDEICLAAVKKYGGELEFVKKQTDEICLAAVSQYYMAIEFVKNQTDEICLIAISKNKKADNYSENFISYIKNRSPAVLSELFKAYPKTVEKILLDVKNQTEDLCLLAVQSSGLALRVVKNKTEKICLAAVNQNGLALRYVKIQTKEMCLSAVKNDGLSIEYVWTQSDEICLAAVRQNSRALRYVKNQTEEIMLAAVEQNGAEIYSIKTPPHNVCLAAVKNNHDAIKYIENQTEDLCMEAIKQSLTSILYIKNQIFDYYQYAAVISQKGLSKLKDDGINDSRINIKYVKDAINSVNNLSPKYYADLLNKNLITPAHLPLTHVRGVFDLLPTQHEKIKHAASHPSVIEYLDDYPESFHIEVLKKNYKAISYIHNKSDQVIIEAYKSDRAALGLIEHLVKKSEYLSLMIRKIDFQDYFEKSIFKNINNMNLEDKFILIDFIDTFFENINSERLFILNDKPETDYLKKDELIDFYSESEFIAVRKLVEKLSELNYEFLLSLPEKTISKIIDMTKDCHIDMSGYHSLNKVFSEVNKYSKFDYVSKNIEGEINNSNYLKIFSTELNTVKILGDNVVFKEVFNNISSEKLIKDTAEWMLRAEAFSSISKNYSSKSADSKNLSGLINALANLIDVASSSSSDLEKTPIFKKSKFNNVKSVTDLFFQAFVNFQKELNSYKINSIENIKTDKDFINFSSKLISSYDVCNNSWNSYISGLSHKLKVLENSRNPIDIELYKSIKDTSDISIIVKSAMSESMVSSSIMINDFERTLKQKILLNEKLSEFNSNLLNTVLKALGVDPLTLNDDFSILSFFGETSPDQNNISMPAFKITQNKELLFNINENLLDMKSTIINVVNNKNNTTDEPVPPPSRKVK